MAKKLNLSDDKRIKCFQLSTSNCVDFEKEIYGKIIECPSSTDFFSFSKKLQRDQIEAKIRLAERKIEEAKTIQHALTKGRSLPKRFQINNHFVKVTYAY